MSLSRWSWYLFAAALVIAVSVTHSIARTGGPIAFPALLVLGGMLPFIGVMKVYRLAIIGGSFIPAYLITLWMTRPAELLETPLDHFWVSFMMLLGVAAVLTRSRIDSSRTERIAELRRRAGRASREVAAEKQRGDRLLLNILPENIADELKSKGRVDPVRYESATVLFTDFKGFTGLAEKMEPENLVGELDRCFRAFDTIAARHGLEKLKTIGDSYMCAGGIPVPSLSHALDCCRAALEMRDYIEELKKVRRAEGKTVWEIRIGIHSGPLVAGVIGESKFSYDVWGDTVNTASRAESSGEPGRINITESTFAEVGHLFECTPRGLVEAKNKAPAKMYFLERLRSDLSKDSAAL